MANQGTSKNGRIAIALGIVAGVLSISRAVYTYSQHGELDTGKIALGIGIPCLVYVLVKTTTRAG